MTGLCSEITFNINEIHYCVDCGCFVLAFFSVTTDYWGREYSIPPLMEIADVPLRNVPFNFLDVRETV